MAAVGKGFISCYDTTWVVTEMGGQYQKLINNYFNTFNTF